MIQKNYTMSRQQIAQSFQQIKCNEKRKGSILNKRDMRDKSANCNI